MKDSHGAFRDSGQRNVEIKARARNAEAQRRLAEGLADAGPELLVQEDTFFHCPDGRLKLRAFPDGTGELIFYVRGDATQPAESRYVLSPAPSASSLRAILEAVLGVRAIVRKQRVLYRVGRTRIHLDQVEKLGPFLELEVVLDEGQPTAEGVKIARKLMEALDIREEDLVARAYVDLLESADAS